MFFCFYVKFIEMGQFLILHDLATNAGTTKSGHGTGSRVQQANPAGKHATCFESGQIK
jgi:hypothetical protein